MESTCTNTNACSPEEITSANTAKETTAKKQKVTNRMVWDNQKDLILIGEVILARPFQYRQGTRERGKAWQEVADAMKALFKVDKRAVRDRVTNLMERVKGRNRMEKAASGIAVEETDEEKRIRESVEDFIQEEEDIENAPKEKGDEEKKKSDGAEMRKRACETYGETRKRHEDESSSTTPRKSRNTGSETLGLIQKKMELDQAMRREEMTRRIEEKERRSQDERARERRYESLQEQHLNQQQQFQQHMQQQQQQFQQQQQQFQQQQLQQQQLMQQQTQQTQSMLMALFNTLEKRD